MYEGRWIFLILIAAAVLATAFQLFFLVLPIAGLILFCIWFFREPERKPPANPALAVSPADGTVSLVDEVEEPQFFRRRMKRVSIFLSVFDVHVNRTPIAGEVIFMEGRGGLYLDARKSESSLLNESLYWVFEPKGNPANTVGVKQVTGAIARRIVPWAKLGELMERGERFGMIRFGSRTDLYLPMDSEVLVSVGQKVKGGETAISKMAS